MYIEPNNFGYNGQILVQNTIYGGMTTSNAYLVHNGRSFIIIRPGRLRSAPGWHRRFLRSDLIIQPATDSDRLDPPGGERPFHPADDHLTETRATTFILTRITTGERQPGQAGRPWADVPYLS
jgi:hypothetical protein